jgi:vancomycin aglycone glucosyltransferase
MRVVLSTYGSRGDVEPLTALAVQLQDRGAQVRFCGPPDFEPSLTELGVEFRPLGWPIRALATGELAGTVPKTLPEITAELTATAYQVVLAAAEDADVVVGAGVLAVGAGAGAAAETLGIPHRHATFSTNYLPSPHHPPVPWPGQTPPAGGADNQTLWELNAEHLQTMLGGPINDHRASVGLPRVDNIRDHVLTEHPLLAADPVLGPWLQPAGLGVVQTGAWIRPDERPLPADLDAFLEAGAAPVYVGFGSMPVREPEQVARAVFEAVRGHGRRVLLGSGWADLARIDAQDDCFVIGEVNQQRLFGRVAAAVHHGGAGTTTTAARAGAPQVIVPQVADQPYWGGRVADLGIGVAHDGPSPTAESLAAALETALAGETATRAKAVADQIRTDGAKVAAELILGRG